MSQQASTEPPTFLHTEEMSGTKGSGSLRRRFRFNVAATIVLLSTTLIFLQLFGSFGVIKHHPKLTHPAVLQPQHLPCLSLPGAEDTVLVMKTGSTEVEAKLPAHLESTLRCFPNQLLFSDTAESFRGRDIIDALESVSPGIKEEHPDFELYRRLREDGRPRLSSVELTGLTRNAGQESWIGHQENPGWKLDKWKFLPMINTTFHNYPAQKWYVFIEADSHILWASLLEYLATLDETRPLYAGVKVFIDAIGFAHGGSGFIVSRPAMQLVVEHFNSHQLEFEDFTDHHWAGDCVLGKAFADAGVPVSEAWPLLQGDPPGMVPYAGPDGRPMPFSDERIWCNKAVSYHHIDPSTIGELWKFEQQWNGSLSHREVFEHFILPRMKDVQTDWDNQSDSILGTAGSLEECRSRCEETRGCLQYAFYEDGRCGHFELPRLGAASNGLTSGWFVDRIQRFMSELPSCEMRIHG